MARTARAAVILIVLAACTSTPYRPSENASSGSVAPSSASSSPPAVADVHGDRLIVLRDDGNLTSMAPDGGGAIPLTSEASADVRVSQPVASPNGRYLAWVEVRADRPSVVVATREGAIRNEIPMRIAPFFLQWDPTSSRIAYLGSFGIGIGFGVIRQATGDPFDHPVGGGSPLYLSWAPDGKELLVHVGPDTLGRTDTRHDLVPLEDAPGTFQAPAWLPDGRTLFDRLDHGTQELVVADGKKRSVLAAFDGGSVAFEPSPDGRRVAYRIDHADGKSDGLYVQDVDGGHRVRVTGERTTAFFWSPRSDALLLMTPEPEASAAQPLHRWRVWDGGMRFVSKPFLPSQTFFQEYVPFFDQYAQALTPWAADGTAFAYAGAQEGGGGIWVQRVERGAAPELVSDGGFVVWSPPER
jgi:WD40 repeat protein